MSLAALIGFMLFVLTVERGWVGDLIAYSSLGVFFGIAVAEGTRRSLCRLIRYRGPAFVLEYFPLVAFLPHVVALCIVSEIHSFTVIVTTIFGFIFWTVNVLSDYCNSAVESMNDFTQHISSAGG